MPPIFTPTSGSFGLPKLAEGPLYAAPVSTGLLSCRPNSEPPGCTAAHRFAVDSARLGRLKELAVFAFCAEMTRLPGHSSPRSLPVNATAQTTPSRLTIVPHMLRPNPPLATFLAAARAALSSAWLGSRLHSLSEPASAGRAASRTPRINALRTNIFIDSPSQVPEWRRGF